MLQVTLLGCLRPDAAAKAALRLAQLARMTPFERIGLAAGEDDVLDKPTLAPLTTEDPGERARYLHDVLVALRGWRTPSDLVARLDDGSVFFLGALLVWPEARMDDAATAVH